ncbi:MAG: EAL domain-containing protein [Armatimonadota bacterium]|nr:EAL domain-containing protein [Armatimonadota bacterium]MDR7563970.1 EAL domain-containing protein [Armatimonadota bacterium]MDR7603000.1 EAL domain-containing protein [Armatimonadota bacterium]
MRDQARWLDRYQRQLPFLLVAGHTALCALLSLWVWKGLPYSATVILVGPVLLAAALWTQRVYLALLPQTAAVTLLGIFLKAPDRPEALVAFLGLAGTVVLLSELLFRISRTHHRTEEALRRRTELQQALHATALGLLQGRRVDALLEEILRRACALLDTPHGDLFLVEGDHLRCRVALGALRWMQETGFRMARGKGIAGQVWETGEPLLVTDYGRWRDKLPDPRLAFTRHAVGIPLVVEQQVKGIVVVARDKDPPFTPEDLTVMEQFGQLASLVLQNASLYQATQEEVQQRRQVEARLWQRTRLLETLHRVMESLLQELEPERLLEAIAQGACELLRTPHCNLFLVEGEVLRCRVALGNVMWTRTEPLEIPRGQGLAGRVWETGLPLIVEDYPHWPGRLPDPRFHGVYHSVGVPIVLQGEVVGVLNLAREDPHDPFTEEEVATLTQFAHLASLVLHSTRLREQVRAAAQSVEAQRAFYEEILHHVQTDIAVFDPHLRYVYVNPSAIRDPELRQWIVGRDDYDYCRRKGRDPALAARRQEFLRRAMEEKRVLEYEEVIPTPSREERHYLRRICPVLDARGEVIRLIGYGLDITERKRMEQRLEHLALHDVLTGLPNRTLFLDRLRQALERTHRAGTQVAVLFVDLDQFKFINDSLGHAAGDTLLIEASRRLEGCLRAADTLARLGGDEFVVLAEVHDPADAARIAERILAALSPPFVLEGEEVYVTASVGISVGDGTRRPEDLLREADTAMYRAKAAGRNRYRYFEETMHLEAVHQLHWDAELRRALERGEFVLHYQPVVRIRDRVPVEMEALIRWSHPQRGLLLPSDFLDAAERAGLGPALGTWVFREACQQLQRWREQFPARELWVSVNLSRSQLQDPQLPDGLTAALQATQAPPQALRLEIPEHVLTGLPPEVLERIGAMPVGVHVDDFHDSLPQDLLERLPVRALKVPWEAISNASERQRVAHHLVTLIRERQISVVVKGVEDPQALEDLAAMGFECVEGFAVARPMAPEVATAYLSETAGR